MLLALLTTLATAQSLSVGGPCPGELTIDVTGLSPGARAALVYSTIGPGGDTLPAGPCRGVAVGLAGPRLATALTDIDR